MRIRQRVLALLSLIICGSALCLAQAPAKEPSASVSGRVTIAGKAASGIIVVATISSSFFDNKTIAKATTDEDGNYKLTALPAGRLSIFPLARSFVVTFDGATKKTEQSVNVAEGEAITKIDFALLRGGVITGRITDADGHPIIGEQVHIVPKDDPETARQQMYMFASRKYQTDDRGIYRVYGLSSGSYRVSVGQAAAGGGGMTFMGVSGQFPKTFYPSVSEEAKATIIELKEGGEVTGIDITVGKLSRGFAVAGPVIDADSGQPVSGVFIGHAVVDEATQQMGAMNFGGGQSDANGKFRLEGLRPGQYAAFSFASQLDNTSYSEPAKFEIADGDVTGIEIKLRRGGTISGVAVLESNSDVAGAALLQTLTLAAYVERKNLGAPSYSRSSIAADGSFQFKGLAPGKARISVPGFPIPPKGLSLVRVELDGADHAEGIELAAGAEVKGVRLVFVYGTGSIRGEVKLEGGTLPEGSAIQVMVRSAGGDGRNFNRVAEIDARLHFFIENLAPGSYELVVRRVTMGGDKPGPPAELLKQTVVVANGAEVKITLAVDVGTKGGEQ
jgi:hypothetical protein